MKESEGKQKGFEAALKRAWALLEPESVALQAANSGARVEDGIIFIRYFGRDYVVDSAAKSILDKDGAELSLVRKILLLHYLICAFDSLPSNDEISFAQIPGAAGYSVPFNGRVVKNLVGMFEKFGDKMERAFRRAGGERVDFATQCYLVRAFPRVVLKVIYWRGDEEIGSGGQVVFRRGVEKILPIEDIVVLCEDLARHLRAGLE